MFVIVERTETRIVLARMAQLDTSLRNEVDDVNAGFDFIKGGHSQRLAFSDSHEQVDYRLAFTEWQTVSDLIISLVGKVLNKNGTVLELSHFVGCNVNR